MMNKLIFFVDDDRVILNLLEYIFLSRGEYNVKSFQSGEKCIESMDHNPDLIVLDHNLSSDGSDNMNGIQTLEKIREVNEDVPVVILTGFGSEELLGQFMQKGAQRFLTKDDFFIDSLIQIIEEMLG